MGTDRLARHNSGTNGTTTNTAEYLAKYLRGLEEIYHSEMTAEELALYLEGLSYFPLCEVKEAGHRLMIHPPDEWTGIPKLPDFIRTIHRMREEHAEQIKRQGGKELADQSCTVCGGSGWEPTETPSGNRAVRRCACWLKAREALRVASRAERADGRRV